MSLRIEMILSDVALEQIVTQVIARLPAGVNPAPTPAPTPDPIRVAIATTVALPVGDDKTAVVNYQRGLPGSRANSMDVLRMKKDVLAIAFRTKPSGRGWATRIEYGGEPWHGDSWISLAPNVWDQAKFGDSYSPPQSTNSLRVAVGENVAGHVRLEPNTDYFYNVRARPWDEVTARQQFSVAIDVAA